MMLITELGYDVSPTFAGRLELGFGIRNLCMKNRADFLIFSYGQRTETLDPDIRSRSHNAIEL